VLALTLALLTGAAACGGRPAPGTGDGGLLSDTYQPGTDGSTPGVDLTSPPTGGAECVVAIRVDNCCTAAHPAPAQQVAQDPCLVPWPIAYPIPAVCKAKWPEKCDLIDCAPMAPVSRLTQPVPGGTCAWKTECETAADCRLAYDARRCCECAQPYPLELVQRELCIHDYTINSPPPKQCDGECAAVKCKPCPPPPQSFCVPSGQAGIKICTSYSL